MFLGTESEYLFISVQVSVEKHSICGSCNFVEVVFMPLLEFDLTGGAITSPFYQPGISFGPTAVLVRICVVKH